MMTSLDESLKRTETTLKAVKSGLDKSLHEGREQTRELREALDAARSLGTVSASEIAEVESLLDGLDDPSTADRSPRSARPLGPPLARGNKSPQVSWFRV